MYQALSLNPLAASDSGRHGSPGTAPVNRLDGLRFASRTGVPPPEIRHSRADRRLCPERTV